MTDSDDLSARARRLELDEGELNSLHRTLESSLEARLAHRAGLEFDAGDAVRPGDDELARRIVGRVVTSRTKPGRRRSRRGWGIAAAALCAGTAAAAIAPLTHLVRSLIGAQDAQAQHVSAIPARAQRTTIPPSRDRDGALLAGPAKHTDPPPVRSTVPARSSATAGVAPVSTSVTAASLFASANLARREGRPAQAIASYEELQHRYPDSTESRAADISLGMLLLDAGSAAGALRHFERYLRAPSADLAPEALWGKSRALVRLGRGDDARAIWELIVNRYPDCAYAKAASAKLSAP